MKLEVSIHARLSLPPQVHIDFENCTLMGYKVFGTCDPNVNKTEGKGAGQISYTTKGKVRAYVQFQQTVPEGFERLGLWPVEVFDWIAPPKPAAGLPAALTINDRPTIELGKLEVVQP